MPELKLYIPTYYPNGAAPNHDGDENFGDPRVPVLIRRADGVRIVLGTHDYWDSDSPDVQIERRMNGWAIFLHPLGGGDASGYIYFTDDGRSFVVPENGATSPVAMVAFDAAVAEIDQSNGK